MLSAGSFVLSQLTGSSTYSIGPETLNGSDEHGLALGIDDLSVDHDLPRRLDVRVESAAQREKMHPIRTPFLPPTDACP